MATFASKVVEQSKLPDFPGYTHTVEENVYRGGCAVYDKHVYTRSIGPVEKWLRIGFCATSILATCPFSLAGIFVIDTSKDGCLDNCARSNCDDPCRGYFSEERFVFNKTATENAIKDEYKQLGFDPNNAASRKEFMEEQTITVGVGGHQYCLVEGPVSNGLICIFAPYGNRDRTTLNYYFNYSTGEKLSTGEAIRALESKSRYYNKPDIEFVPNIHTQGETSETEPLLTRQPRVYYAEENPLNS